MTTSPSFIAGIPDCNCCTLPSTRPSRVLSISSFTCTFQVLFANGWPWISYTTLTCWVYSIVGKRDLIRALHGALSGPSLPPPSVRYFDLEQGQRRTPPCCMPTTQLPALRRLQHRHHLLDGSRLAFSLSRYISTLRPPVVAGLSFRAGARHRCPNERE
ncbi:hypothetical protein BDQ17DRAFT_880784 [Cyathus striatus]|nr:hypothetical protein BDQ17DRAFT_880784 [Cyathus striatus]